MDKRTFGLLLICLHLNVALGANQRLQNANLDFLNFESNNPKVTPSPSPAIAQKPLPPNPIRDYVAPTKPSSNVRQIVKTFNDHLTDSDKIPNPNVPALPFNKNVSPNPNVPAVPVNKNVSPTPSTTTIQPKAPTPQPSTSTTGNKPSNQNVQPAKPTFKPTTVRESFPALPNSGGAPKVPSVPSVTPKSWSSVVGNKQAGNVANVATKPPAIAQPSIPTRSNNPPTVVNPKPTQIPMRANNAATEATPVIATDAELKTISEALFKKEANIAKYFTINPQGKTTSFSHQDEAPQPLITIEPDLWKVPTIAAMKALLDNYEQNTTVNEYVTPQEKNEENTFLDLIMATPVMRQLMIFLKDKGLVSPDAKQQRDVVKQIWFNMYSRGLGKIGSSGFEHIFLSEIKNNEVSGLHNWIYFQTQEALNNVNYLGYMKKLDFNNQKSGILKLHFNMKGIDKPVDTLFFGTTPELEMSLYTLCFLTRVDQGCHLSTGQQQFNLRTHNFRYRSKNMIGSAFPEFPI